MRRVFFLLLPLLFLEGCGKIQPEPITQSGMYFDTIISITLYDGSQKSQLEHCFQMADTYEHYFSAKREDSDISKINAANGKPVQVHEETIALVKKGLEYGKLSNGKFDITVGRLTDLWDYQAEDPTLPSEEEIRKILSHVDYNNVVVKDDTVMLKDKEAALDLGGIAKGYIADQMKEYLISEGVTSGIINLGGNVLAIGTKVNGDSYQIGIQRPFAEDGESIAAVKIKDLTVVSSGIYERYFEKNGTLYHHILDTATGYPYQNELYGVTIICKNSVDGDGLSTTCFALGLEDGMAFIESMPDTEAIFITNDGKMHYSSGIGTKIPIQEL